jgi:hypothetical protein
MEIEKQTKKQTSKKDLGDMVVAVKAGKAGPARGSDRALPPT